MSNVDARLRPYIVAVRSQTVRGWRGVAPRGLPETGGRRRRLFAAILFASDVVSGALAIVAAAVIVAAAAGQMGLVGRMQTQMCLLLLLLLGINCSLGLYRSNIRSPMERFRLRATATLLFVFAGMLMWIRAGAVGRTGNRASGWRQSHLCSACGLST